MLHGRMGDGMPSPVDLCHTCGIVRRSHDPSPHIFIEPDGSIMYDSGDLDIGSMDPNRQGFLQSARKYMLDCGLRPTPDAIAQLDEVFLPCLTIMCRRGYDPDGGTWRAEGWRGMLWKIRDKSDRLWYHGWLRGIFHPDHAPDMINYLGFYMRAERDKPWGTRGAPGNEENRTNVQGIDLSNKKMQAHVEFLDENENEEWNPE